MQFVQFVSFHSSCYKTVSFHFFFFFVDAFKKLRRIQMKSFNIISWITDPIAAIKIFKNKTNQKPNIETKQTNERMNKQQTNKKQTKQTKHAKHNTHKAGLKISFFCFIILVLQPI